MEVLQEVKKMLVLKVGHNGRVYIGTGVNQVIVTVIEVFGDSVHLGFSADKSIPINREKVHRALQREVTS